MPRLLLQLLVPCAFLSGCFGPGEGLEAPAEQIYFPIGLALDASREHLVVVSSDFDLQYNGGAVQSYRLGRKSLAEAPQPDGLFDLQPVRCNDDAACDGGTCDDGLCIPPGAQSPCPNGDRAPADQLLYPGRCRPIQLKPLSTAKIGAFATDAVRRSQAVDEQGTESGAERLFVPVRGDTTLHWFDIRDGVLDCGQDSNDGACDERHRAGNDAAAENSRGLELAAEPFGIDATETGDTIVVTNQTTGTASLFVNDWSDVGPRLKFALSSDRIPSRPVGIASLPRTRASLAEGAPSSLTPDAFLMTFSNAAQVRLLRFAPDSSPENPTQPREYLVDAGGVGIDANSVGTHSRGLAVDASARQDAERRCAGDTTCLAEAALIPMDVYVASRSPASLLIGRTRPPLEYPYFFQSLPLTVGPSRVVVGKIRTPNGEETRVFVVCFDSRRIFVYDPQRARFEAEILTGRGPHAVAVDTERSLLYVAHFTDSYVGVFSLDLASPATYGTMLGTLGTPRPPRSSK